MDFTIKPSIVYIKVSDQNVIKDVNSDGFLSDTNGWIKLDEGYGDKYLHAQGNYFPQHIKDENGIGRYLYTPDASMKWRERTQEEMDADVEPPAAQPSDSERITALEEQLAAAKILLGVE